MDQQSLVDALRRGKNWAAGQFSLDTPEQDLISPESAGDLALGFVPGVGQAMSFRDMARAYKQDDYTGMGLAAAGLIPGGKLLKGVKNKIWSPAESLAKPPYERMANYEQLEKSIQKGNQGVQPGTKDARDWAWGNTQLLRDPEGTLMSEIPANRFSTKSKGTYHEGAAQDVFEHPELFYQHPDARLVDFTGEIVPGTGRSGSYLPSRSSTTNPLIEATAGDRRGLLQVADHEFTHHIADKAGITPGTSPTIAESWMFGGGHVPPVQSTAEQTWRKKMAHEMYDRDLNENWATAGENRVGVSPRVLATVNPEDQMKRPWDQLLTQQQQKDPEFLTKFLQQLRTEGHPLGNEAGNYFKF